MAEEITYNIRRIKTKCHRNREHATRRFFQTTQAQQTTQIYIKTCATLDENTRDS